MDPYKYLKIRLNPDGSLCRYGEAPLLPAAPAGEPVAVEDEQGARRIVVHSSDVPLNDATGTGLRLFVPSGSGGHDGGRLPLVVYFHGGGYVLFRGAFAPFHNACAALAAPAPTVVASVDYPLGARAPPPHVMRAGGGRDAGRGRRQLLIGGTGA